MRPGIVAEIQRQVHRASQRVLGGIVRRGLVALAQADGFIQAEGYEGELFDELELWQGYGIATRPPAGSEILVLIAGPAGQSAVAIGGTSRADRPTDIEQDEVRLYGVQVGGSQAAVRMRADGDVDVDAATGQTVNLTGGDEPIVLGTQLYNALAALASALASAVTVPNINAAGTSLTAALGSILSAKAKVG